MTKEIMVTSDFKEKISVEQSMTRHSLELLLDVATNLIHDEITRLKVQVALREIRDGFCNK